MSVAKVSMNSPGRSLATRRSEDGHWQSYLERSRPISMSSHRIALLFEYSTLNGGERSMLAVLDALMPQSTGFDFVAIAPPEGRLADALRRRKIPVVDWSSRYLPYREHPKNVGLEDANYLTKTSGPQPPIQIDFGSETQERRVPVEEIESSLIRIVSDLKPDFSTFRL